MNETDINFIFSFVIVTLAVFVIYSFIIYSIFGYELYSKLTIILSILEVLALVLYILKK
jgi:hypothetical protein